MSNSEVDISSEAVAVRVRWLRDPGAPWEDETDQKSSDMLESLAADRDRIEKERDEANADLETLFDAITDKDGAESRPIAEKLLRAERILADCCQAVGMLGETMGLGDNEDFVRLQDMLAYGKTEDGKPLLPFPLIPNVRAEKAEADRDRWNSLRQNAERHCTVLTIRAEKAEAERDEARRELAANRSQAEEWEAIARSLERELAAVNADLAQLRRAGK